jgi:hypothetical protein
MYIFLYTIEIPFLETSALQKINVEKAFQLLVEEIHKKYVKLHGNEIWEDDFIKTENTIDLNKKPERKKTFDELKKACCSSV